MYCSNCGAQNSDNSRFCQNCGQLMHEAERQSITAASTYEGPMGNPTPVLVWGIVSLACACTFVVSFLGIIFGCIGKKKADQYLDFCGGGSKQATIGRNLSKAGIIVGVILTVLFVIYIALLVYLFQRGGGAAGFDKFIKEIWYEYKYM